MIPGLCARCGHWRTEHLPQCVHVEVAMVDGKPRLQGSWACECPGFATTEELMEGVMDNAGVERDPGMSHVTMTGMLHRTEEALMGLAKCVEFLELKLEPVLRPNREENGPLKASCGASQSPVIVSMIGHERAIQNLTEKVAKLTGRLDLDDPGKTKPVEMVGPELPRFDRPEVYGDRPGYRRDA